LKRGNTDQAQLQFFILIWQNRLDSSLLVDAYPIVVVTIAQAKAHDKQNEKHRDA